MPPPPGNLLADISSRPPVPPPEPWYPTGLDPLQGYFEGFVTTGGSVRFTDGLVTADGLAHLHISGSPADSYELRGAVQLIGRVVGDANRLEGSGTVVGEACGQLQGRFCTETATAEISLTLTPDRTDGLVVGEIKIATSAGDETWSIELRYPERRFRECREPCYLGDASIAYAARVYYSERAEFGRGVETTLSVDTGGRLFFQGPTSGCIGNGALSPHLDGAMNVFDVTMIIEGCKGENEYLNGELEGLANMETACDTFDCIYLQIYAAAKEHPPRKSVTMWWRGL